MSDGLLSHKHTAAGLCPLFAVLQESAAIILLLSAAIVSACQPLSHPFQPEGQTAALAGFLEPGPRSGLIVTNVGVLPGPSLHRLTELLVASLRDRNIAATTDSNKYARYRLQGNIELEDGPFATPEDALTVAIRWKLFDPQGDFAGSLLQEELFSAVAWRDLDDTTIMTIVGRAAPRIERLLDGYEDTSIPPEPVEDVVVYRVDGAPGDGGTALLRGMQHALKVRHISVVDSITEDTYVVLGAVQIDDGPSDNQQIVQIDWTIIRPDGRRLGSIRQQNSILAGKLDGAWGAIATAVTYGGAEGIVSLLKAIRAEWPNAAPIR